MNSLKMRGIVFDLDGTLVNSLADLGESMNRVLTEMALPEHALGDYRRYVGDGIRMLVTRALPEAARSEEYVVRAVERLRVVYGARWDLKTRPYDGMAETLARMKALQLPLGVLSNKPHGLTLNVVERFFPPGTFAAVLGAEAGFARKPEPDGAIELARRLSVHAQDCLYVGDTATDMLTAHAAGMYPVGALWGFRDAEELLSSGARLLVKRPVDLIEIVASRMPSA
jgi:phosphoglycolate phosphatase